MKTTAKVAFGGIIGALSLACMFLTVFPFTEMALPAVAGAVLMPVVLEIGAKWGLMVYAADALLALLIAPNMEAKVLFIAFFGYYPVLKAILERLNIRWLEWLIKLVLFNVSMVVSYWLMMRFFGLPDDTFELFGVNLPLVILAFANVVFLLYDLTLTVLVGAYIRRLRPKLRRVFR